MTIPNLQRLRQHVYELAAAFEVRVVETDLPPDRAAAEPNLRVVVVGRIVDETTYAVALHELGHVVDANGQQHTHQLLAEESAWAWARYVALDWTDSMTSVEQYALGTYHAAAAQQEAQAKWAATTPPANAIDWEDFK